jgi:molecular chaperone DnaJ
LVLAKRDYYDVLEVPKGASKDEIKKAYRRLAIKYHPDRNPGNKESEERFKEATEAYEILANDGKRQAYDQFGFAGVEGMRGGSTDFSSVFRDFEDIFGDFSGIFDSFFGSSGRRGSGRNPARRGSDLRYDMEVSFIDAAFGRQSEVSFIRNEICQTCRGSGSETGGKKICGNCGGSGQVRRSSGFFSIATTCPVCNGGGEVIENPCRECGGGGLVRKKQTIKVTVPAGIDDGKRINIPEQGDSGISGGPSGNLYVYVHVRTHDYFEREGNDLYCMIPISVTQAALGAEIFVSTLDKKKMKVKIPSGTQNGKVLRLRNEGVPYLHDPSRRGDLYIKILVVVPTKLSSKAKELLKEFSGLNGENDSPKPVRLSEIP